MPLQKKFARIAGKKWYCTGDRGSWTVFKHQKHLLLRGRIDRQAKIGGHRIELDEISRCLNTCEDTKQTHVIANNNQLVAFYVGSASKASTEKTFAKGIFESYKIPTHYIQITAFPLNKNGKICDDQLLKKYNTWQKDEVYHQKHPDTLTCLIQLIQKF